MTDISTIVSRHVHIQLDDIAGYLSASLPKNLIENVAGVMRRAFSPSFQMVITMWNEMWELSDKQKRGVE